MHFLRFNSGYVEIGNVRGLFEDLLARYLFTQQHVLVVPVKEELLSCPVRLAVLCLIATQGTVVLAELGFTYSQEKQFRVLPGPRARGSL